ncbi:winged helix-turn-helix transcriptional regulator [Catenulispora yoronensis]
MRVLQALLANASTSRPELVRLTGLSRATVSVLVNDLVAAGIVQEDAGGPAAEPENRSMGRPPLTLALNRAIAYAVGVDIGHAHVRVALCDLYGTPVWEEVEAKEVDRAPHETLDLAARLVHRALAECEVPAERVLGLGGGIAAPSTATARSAPRASCPAGPASGPDRSWRRAPGCPPR